jgi:hypothetical protein
MLLAVPLVLSLGIFPALATAQDTSGNGGNGVPHSGPGLTAVVGDILRHEVRAQAEDKSAWCYRKLERKDGKAQLFSACQTPNGEIDRLLAVNGTPLTENQWNQENERIERLLNNHDQFRKKQQQQADDARQATDLMKIIPDAFTFQQESRDGDNLKLRFFPNPAFHPSGYSQMVFHHMDGTLTLNMREKRLVEISGRLNSEVRFFGGLLGHLDQGGTFYVRQKEVAPGCWEMSRIDVQMDGRALFFKTITVRTNEIDTDFHAVSPAASMQQIAALTKSSSDSNFGGSPR